MQEYKITIYTYIYYYMDDKHVYYVLLSHERAGVGNLT